QNEHDTSHGYICRTDSEDWPSFRTRAPANNARRTPVSLDPGVQIDYGRRRSSMKRAKFVLFVGALALGCGGTLGGEPEWPVESKRWYDRALASYETLDAADARSAVNKAIQAEPTRRE